MHQNYTIQEIIKGCLQGKASFQKLLVQKHSAVLYSVCLRYMRDEMAAQDILQDSFIKIFKYIDRFDENRGNFEAWIRKITVNTALKQLDKRKLETSSLSYETVEHPSADPFVISQMNKQDLMKVVMSLPDGYRQVFNMAVIEGYSHKEIGNMLGIAEVTSRSNLSRAKQILRKKISANKNNETWARIS